MICETVFDFQDRLSPKSRILGLDYGDARIGVAISDRDHKVASPIQQVMEHTPEKRNAAIFEIVDTHQVGGLVIGLPLNMNGSQGPRSRATHGFCAALLNHRRIPIFLQDERLSTAAVERILVQEADLSRAKRRGVTDKMAACYILQGALDLLNSQSPVQC